MPGAEEGTIRGADQGSWTMWGCNRRRSTVGGGGSNGADHGSWTTGGCNRRRSTAGGEGGHGADHGSWTTWGCSRRRSTARAVSPFVAWRAVQAAAMLKPLSFQAFHGSIVGAAATSVPSGDRGHLGISVKVTTDGVKLPRALQRAPQEMLRTAPRRARGPNGLSQNGYGWCLVAFSMILRLGV